MNEERDIYTHWSTTLPLTWVICRRNMFVSLNTTQITFIVCLADALVKTFRMDRNSCQHLAVHCVCLPGKQKNPLLSHMSPVKSKDVHCHLSEFCGQSDIMTLDIWVLPSYWRQFRYGKCRFLLSTFFLVLSLNPYQASWFLTKLIVKSRLTEDINSVI